MKTETKTAAKASLASAASSCSSRPMTLARSGSSTCRMLRLSNCAITMRGIDTFRYSGYDPSRSSGAMSSVSGPLRYADPVVWPVVPPSVGLRAFDAHNGGQVLRPYGWRTTAEGSCPCTPAGRDLRPSTISFPSR